MKIAIIGYGKMGKAIDEIATKRGHKIVARLQQTPDLQSINKADIAIEFSQPEAAYTNIKACLDLKIPVVCGTTGWLEKKAEIENIAKENKTAFLYASNFSLGVNLFFALNSKLAQLMNSFPEYNIQLEEIHHTQKKDAPSGTAISLAESILHENKLFSSWKLGKTEEKMLGINAFREDEVPGTHTIYYRSEIDEIEIKHTAFSRKGFAQGAVIAAEWLQNKTGIFSMKDVLGL